MIDPLILMFIMCNRKGDEIMRDITDKERELILEATAQGIDLHEMEESIERFISKLLDNDLLQKNIKYIVKNKHK